MARSALLALASTLALLASSACAFASPADVSATQGYLRANYRLVQSASGRIHLGEATLRNVLARVRRECPRAAAGSPQNPESTQLSNEVIGVMVTSAIRPDLASIRQYLAAAARLRWSSGGLTRSVQGYVAKLRTLASLAVPDICSDVRSWAASGFKVLPASTKAFDRRFEPSWVALGELPSALSRFESGEGRALARRAGQRETELTDFEAREVETWGQIMSALELNP
jgi:hypothetical protein